MSSLERANMHQSSPTSSPGIAIEACSGFCIDHILSTFNYYDFVHEGDTDKSFVVGSTDCERGVIGFFGGLGLSV